MWRRWRVPPRTLRAASPAGLGDGNGNRAGGTRASSTGTHTHWNSDFFLHLRSEMRLVAVSTAISLPRLSTRHSERGVALLQVKKLFTESVAKSLGMQGQTRLTPLVVSRREATAILGIGLSSLKAILARGDVREVRIGRRSLVRTIDDVVAYLLHDTGHRIAPYLDSCYGLDHAAELDFVHDDVLHAYSLTTSAALPYLRADALVEINELLKAMPRPKFRRLQAAVNAMFRRQLMPYVAGDREPSKLMFEELADVFRRHDVDLARWLKPKNELEERLHEDLFEKRVRKAVRAIRDPAARARAESAVISAFDEFRRFDIHRTRRMFSDQQNPTRTKEGT